jgi:murein DD-endopeptidase MepM/ murein hydrolase activator NlpD
VPNGTQVYSAAAGVVAATGYDPSNGHYVFINNSDGTQSRHIHLLEGSITVQDGANPTAVVPGTPIAKANNSGASDGAHLHFGVRQNQQNGPKVNPNDYVNRACS